MFKFSSLTDWDLLLSSVVLLGTSCVHEELHKTMHISFAHQRHSVNRLCQEHALIYEAVPFWHTSRPWGLGWAGLLQISQA